MDPFEVVLLSLVALALIVGAILPYFYGISGTWEHVETSALDSDGSDYWAEHMRLTHVGPIVVGGASVAGGKQNFLGIALGKHIYLSRRDFGVQYFARKGFPEGLSSDLSGRVMARMHLRLSADNMRLEGTFTPFRVEFDRNTLKVKRVIPVEKKKRLYRRMGQLEDEATKGIEAAVQANNSG